MTIKNTDQPVDQKKYGTNYDEINWNSRTQKPGDKKEKTK